MKTLLITATLLLMSVSCAQSAPSNSNTKVQTGKASYYSTSCNGGTKTASGKKLNNNANTVAHKTLPMGTKVKVTNLRNGKSEICQVSDRGPYVRGRIVDVTIGVARKLDFVKAGVVDVKIEVLN